MKVTVGTFKKITLSVEARGQGSGKSIGGNRRLQSRLRQLLSFMIWLKKVENEKWNNHFFPIFNIPALVQFNGKLCKISLLHSIPRNRTTCCFLR